MATRPAKDGHLLRTFLIQLFHFFHFLSISHLPFISRLMIIIMILVWSAVYDVDFFLCFLFFFLLKVICSLKFQFCENFSKPQPLTEVNFYGAAHWYIRQMDPLSNKKICLWCFCLFPPCPSPPRPPVSWDPSSVTKNVCLWRFCLFPPCPSPPG